MAKLLRGQQQFNLDTGDPDGLIVHYLVGTDARSLWLSEADITGLSLPEIKALAQTRADADAGLPGDDGALFDFAKEAKADFDNLPNWATWTGQEAADALKQAILSGMSKQEARDAIDAQFATVTNLATLASVCSTLIKQLSDAVIDGRDVGHQNEARAIMYLRDIVVGE